MSSRRNVRSLLSLSAVTVTLIGAQLAAPLGAHAQSVTRYASPTGASTDDCSAAHPCDITTAITAAPAGATIHLAAGSYGTTTDPLATTLAAPARATIVGAPGNTSVVRCGCMGTFYFPNGGTLSDVTVDAPYAIAPVYMENASADHIIVNDVNSDLAAVVLVNSTLLDSLVVEPGVVPAVAVESASVSSSAIRNSTVISTAATGGVAVAAENEGNASETATISNSILRGTKYAVEVGAGSGASTIVNLDHTDYGVPAGQAVTHKDSNGGTETINIPAGVNNTQALPKFVDAANDNYQEAAGSPTIDKGAPASGTDLAGRPRTLGSAPDMGAYERPEPPAIQGFKVVKRTQHSLSFVLKVNPGGLASTAAVTASGHGGGTGSGRSIGKATTTRTLHFKLTGLHAHRKYHVHASASNSAGKSRTPTRTVSTKRAHHH